ncbi:MAG: hypothetical protein F4Y68_12815 [Boseongicola sp. SB0665_bin_10]|nr:hypothetical protein [Boseongicola sp. SB0665_bin_10]
MKAQAGREHGGWRPDARALHVARSWRIPVGAARSGAPGFSDALTGSRILRRGVPADGGKALARGPRRHGSEVQDRDAVLLRDAKPHAGTALWTAFGGPLMLRATSLD